MLYPLYKALKAELLKETFLKKVSWFNNQYTDGLVIDTSAFIEFQNDQPVSIPDKDTLEMEVQLRIHYVKKLMANTDGTIPDAVIETTDTELNNIATRLHGFKPVNGAVALTLRPMKITSVNSFQKQNGWQAYYIDFTTRIEL